jgi:hypothetical protein
MTTKPKPRKRPAKAPPVKPAPKGTPQEVSEIEKLCARLKWLDADSEYQTEMASTDEEADTLTRVHDREHDKIVSRLAGLRPETLWEVKLLLEFVQIYFQAGRMDEMDRAIFENVIDSLHEVGRNIEKKARDRAYSEALDRAAEAGGKMLRNLLEMKSQSDQQRWPGYWSHDWPRIRAELNKMLAAEIPPPKEAAA